MASTCGAALLLLAAPYPSSVLWTACPNQCGCPVTDAVT